jgi:ribosomal-protein-alanine N-acetyltransferase
VRFALRPLGQADAEEVAAWAYPGEYAFYDAAADADDLALLLDAERRGDDFYAADGDDGRLAGYFQLKPGPQQVELGLGLRPDLCGHGLGQGFTQAGIDLIRRVHGERPITVAVAAFNARAITVYERCGFAVTGRHTRHTAGSDWEFVDMELGRAGVGSAPPGRT